MTEELIKVPDIGGAEGAEAVEVLVAPGDTIEVEQSLIVVESDKASMEIPTPLAGVVGELRVAVGDMVSEGDVILSVAASSAPASSDAVSGSAADDVSVEFRKVGQDATLGALERHVGVPCEIGVLTIVTAATQARATEAGAEHREHLRQCTTIG